MRRLSVIHNKPLEEMSSSDRKRHPIARGVLDYFPDAIAAVANVSLIGNEQHNPGEPMHWAREKSQDHADCIARHLLARGTLDDDGVLHSAKTNLPRQAPIPKIPASDRLVTP
jgi:hypothetical protein